MPRSPGGSKDRDLPDRPVGFKNFETVPELFHRGIEHLHVSAVQRVRVDLQSRHDQLFGKIGIRARTGLMDQFMDELIQFGISGLVGFVPPETLFHHSPILIRRIKSPG